MPSIELPKIRAGETPALKAKRYLFLPYLLAVFLNPGAVFILYPAPPASMLQVFFFK